MAIPRSSPATLHGRLELVDAMRALAVVAVVLFHVFPKHVGGGFIGVDIFFAISGFVIALRYLDALITGETSFPKFFLRRVRRLVPAYFVLLAIVSLVAAFVMVPKDLANFGQSLASQFVYLQNVAFFTQGNYFDDPLLKPLLHTWSLAVEEQFYLVFPLLVLVMRWNRTVGLWLLAVATVTAIVLGLVIARISPVAAFFLLPFRVWEFTVGIASAIVYRRFVTARIPQAAATLAGLFSIALILWSIIGFDETAVFPSLQSGIAILGSCVLFVVQAHVAPWLRRAGANPVVQHFGRISYSWYLWHWPILSFRLLWSGRPATMPEAVIELLLGYGAGALSYHFVERWGQQGPALRSPRRALALLAAFSGFSLLVGSTMVLSRGMIDRYSGRERLLFEAQMDRPPHRCPFLKRIRTSDEFCLINDVSTGDGVLLIGDSHADLMKPVLATLATRAKRPFYLVKQDCRVIDYGRDFYCRQRQWGYLLDQIRRDGITDVIVISRYAQKFDPDRFTRAIEDLARTGARVTIEPTAPESPEFDPETWINRRQMTQWPTVSHYRAADYRRDYAEILQTMRAVAARNSNVRLVEPLSLLCPDRCLIALHGYPLYHDRHHLTSVGAEAVAPLYAPIFQKGTS